MLLLVNFTGKGNELYKDQLGKKKKQTMMKHLKFSIEDLRGMDFYRESHTPY